MPAPRSRADAADRVRAAGALVWRRAPGGLELLVVHNARYGEWSWPKGKPEGDPRGSEPLAACAVREVAEESGAVVRLGRALPPVSYVLPDGRRKRVDYWAARAIEEGPRTAGADEIDDADWVPAAEVPRRLTRRGELGPLDRLLRLDASGQLETSALVVVRHAKAVSRKRWDGTESDRPLTPDGERQAAALVPLLAAWRPSLLASSPWIRCADTFAPYAAAAGTRLHAAPELTEDAALADSEDAMRLARRLAAVNEDAALCTHRPVLPAVLGALRELSAPGAEGALPVRDPYLAKAALLVAHVSGTPSGPLIRALERHHVP